MRGTAKCYDSLREYVEELQVIDCHDHSGECVPKYEDPAQVLFSGYFRHDIMGVSSERDLDNVRDPKSKSLEERWPLIERLWKDARHTGYGMVSKLVLKKFYGVEKVTLESLEGMIPKLLDLTDEKLFESILDEAKIVARLENISGDTNWIKNLFNGTQKLTPKAIPVIKTPPLQSICCFGDVQYNMEPLDITVTSLDEYLDGCRKLFDCWVKAGAVAFKDQSAYSRTINYENPTKHEAEKVFNLMMSDPRKRLAYPDQQKPLGDYLFHEFMRMARDLDIPVQIHTGHMAGTKNEIRKTNAIQLTNLINLHQDVKFDIFHANWPYSGELLFLAKNYPNVAIDFCWANIIDPIYCQNMMKQAVSSVPHSKVHGFGADYGGMTDRAWAHAKIAKDNISIALSDLVEIEYIDLDEAKEIAKGWLFDNPNRFFKLGL